jgi:hypothetical protein
MNAPSTLGLEMETRKTGDVVITCVVHGDTSIGALSTGTVQPGDQLLKIDNMDVQHMRIDAIKELIFRSHNASGQEHEFVELMILRKSCSFQFIVHVPRPEPNAKTQRQNQVPSSTGADFAPTQKSAPLPLGPRVPAAPLAPRGETTASTARTMYVAWMGAVLEERGGKVFLQKLEESGAASRLLKHPSVRLAPGDVLQELNGQQLCSMDIVKDFLKREESHMLTIVVTRPATGQRITAVLPRPAAAEKLSSNVGPSNPYALTPLARQKGSRGGTAISPSIRDSVKLFEQCGQKQTSRQSSDSPMPRGENRVVNDDREESAPRSTRVPSWPLHMIHSKIPETSPRTPPPLPERPTPQQPGLASSVRVAYNAELASAQTPMGDMSLDPIGENQDVFRLDFVDTLSQAISCDDDTHPSTRVSESANHRAARFSGTSNKRVEAPPDSVSSPWQQEQDAQQDAIKRDVETCYSNVDIALVRDEVPRAYEWLHKATVMSCQLGLADHDRAAATHSKIQHYQELQVHYRNMYRERGSARERARDHTHTQTQTQTHACHACHAVFPTFFRGARKKTCAQKERARIDKTQPRTVPVRDASIRELFPGHGIRAGDMFNDSKPRSKLDASQKSENLHKRLPGASNRDMPCVLETRKIVKDPSMQEPDVPRPRSAPDMGTGSGVVQHVDGKLMIRQMHASSKTSVKDDAQKLEQDVALLRRASLGRAAETVSLYVRAEDARNAVSGRENDVSHHPILWSSPQVEVMTQPSVQTHHFVIRDGVKGQKVPADMQDEDLLPIVCNRLFGPATPRMPIDEGVRGGDAS